MTLYTVHLPSDAPNRIAEAERAVIVPEAFSWGALIWGPVWLLAKRAWLGAFAWLVAVVALVLLFRGLASSTGLLVLTLLALGIFFGLEGRQFLRGALARRGYRLADVVSARNTRDAEQAFFTRWLGTEAGAAAPTPAPPRSPPPPPSDSVLGLFPEPEGRP